MLRPLVDAHSHLRTPALATEAGPLRPETLDRLIRWTRRVLGELPPDVASRLAHANAERLFRLK
ncbi:MAG: hypothetical protein HY359_07410 [Candidatus Rokubacteria bacterium]|nr:hypothetical protein [Candidatus Rokubacteria bacterium]